MDVYVRWMCVVDGCVWWVDVCYGCVNMCGRCLWWIEDVCDGGRVVLMCEYVRWMCVVDVYVRCKCVGW